MGVGLRRDDCGIHSCDEPRLLSSISRPACAGYADPVRQHQSRDYGAILVRRGRRRVVTGTDGGHIAGCVRGRAVRTGGNVRKPPSGRENSPAWFRAQIRQSLLTRKMGCRKYPVISMQ